MAGKLVLVTGASGYIAAHVVQQLQLAGYRVRGTVRDLKNELRVAPLRTLAPGAKHELELVEADLENYNGWDKAVEGCWAVMHVASPCPYFGSAAPEADSLVKPAVEGTIKVLRAAAEAGVKKVVLTSSIAAMADGSVGNSPRVYTEEDWSDPKAATIGEYSKSKVLAEKAAWDLLKKLPESKKFELSVVNPAFVMGPPLLGCNKGSTSVRFIADLLNCVNPLGVHVMFNFCDVRDVARVHLEAMTNPAASGNRHIVCSDSMWMREVAHLLSDEFAPQGYAIPTRVIPYAIIWASSFFVNTAKLVRKMWGKDTTFDNSRMVNVLGIEPTCMEKSVIDMAYSMINMGIVLKTSQYNSASQQINY